jgi:hypothetical protein
VHVDPEIPEGVTERDLDQGARMELKTLAKDTSDFVAKHLVMASALIDTDPELAHQHALSASRRGGRIAMVRETLAITAYTVGDFALALRELRTYRRISGKDDQIALMVDSERGLGRPDRALELGRSVDESKLDTNGKVQLAIAMSGARLDQGQPELALAELEIPQLDRTRAFSYSPALFGAYAAVLTDLGRDAEAATWQKAAELAEAALADAEHNEYETIDFVTEANPDYVEPEPTEEELAEAAVDDEDETDAASDSETQVADEPEANEPDATQSPSVDDDEFARASVEAQVEAEIAEIFAEIDDATEAEAEAEADEVAAAVEAAQAEDAAAENAEAEDVASEDAAAAADVAEESAPEFEAVAEAADTPADAPTAPQAEEAAADSAVPASEQPAEAASASTEPATTESATTEHEDDENLPPSLFDL